jgi:TRAP-type C4-dicarboxylate transport system permease small subunit
MMRHLIGRLNLALALAAGGGMLLLAGLTVNEVIRRYVLNSPTSWSLEMTEYSLLFCVYFGMAYSIQTRSHVSVPLVYDRLSIRTQRILDAMNSILVLVFWIVLFWQTLDMAIDYFTRNVRSDTLLATPLVYPMSLVVIGSFFSCFQAILDIYDSFHRSSSQVRG